MAAKNPYGDTFHMLANKFKQIDKESNARNSVQSRSQRRYRDRKMRALLTQYSRCCLNPVNQQQTFLQFDRQIQLVPMSVMSPSAPFVYRFVSVFAAELLQRTQPMHLPRHGRAFITHPARSTLPVGERLQRGLFKQQPHVACRKPKPIKY